MLLLTLTHIQTGAEVLILFLIRDQIAVVMFPSILVLEIDPTGSIVNVTRDGNVMAIFTMFI